MNLGHYIAGGLLLLGTSVGAPAASQNTDLPAGEATPLDHANTSAALQTQHAADSGVRTETAAEASQITAATAATVDGAPGNAAPSASAEEAFVEEWGWGPFYWEQPASEGVLGMQREFAAGPFWEQRWSENRHDWFLRPFWANYYHIDEGRHDGHFIPPLFTLRETPESHDWNVLLFIRNRYIGNPDDPTQQTFYLFPLFFYNYDSVVTDHSFWGLFPIYGELQYFFAYRKMFWVLFPLYARNERWDGTVRTGTPWPFIQTFSGPDNTEGLYLWPLWGQAKRDNHFKSQFVLWPLVYSYVDGLDKPVPRVRAGFLPFYALDYGPRANDVSILMFWGWREDFARNYHESRYLWPLFVQGRGPDNYVNRWAPFYTHSIHPFLEKKWWMWPLVQYRKAEEKGLVMERSQFFYFLYWHETQRSIENPDLPQAEMTFVWPFYADYDNGAGVTQTQILSIFEVFFPHNRATRDTYSPLFALFRSEADTNKGVRRWSLLWNLVASQSVETEAKTTESFHIWPLYQSKSEATAANKSEGFSILGGLIGWRESSATAAPSDNSTGTADSATAAGAATAESSQATAKIPVATATDTSATAASSITATSEGAAEPAEGATRSTLTLLWFDIEL